MITLPSSINAGDTLTGSASYADYPASDGWALTVALFNSGGAFNFNATADGDDFAISVDAVTTSAWTAGRYDYSAYVSKGFERITVHSGCMDINPDPSLGVAADGRSHARKLLDSIEAMIEGRASAGDLDILEGQLNSRSYKREGDGYLITLRDKYRAEVMAEDRANKIANGEIVSQSLKTRF